jgi:hypothetical protein
LFQADDFSLYRKRKKKFSVNPGSISLIPGCQRLTPPFLFFCASDPLCLKWRYRNSRVKETIVKEAIAPAETSQKRADALKTQRERSRYRQLVRLQSDPKNKMLITKLIELWNGIKKAAGLWLLITISILNIEYRTRNFE